MVVTVSLAGEDLLGQHPVDLGVGVAAAVGQDGEAVVEVGRLAEGGQDDAAGGEAGQDEVVAAYISAGHRRRIGAGCRDAPGWGRLRGDGRLPCPLDDHGLKSRGTYRGITAGGGIWPTTLARPRRVRARGGRPLRPWRWWRRSVSVCGRWGRRRPQTVTCRLPGARAGSPRRRRGRPGRCRGVSPGRSCARR